MFNCCKKKYLKSSHNYVLYNFAYIKTNFRKWRKQWGRKNHEHYSCPSCHLPSPSHVPTTHFLSGGKSFTQRMNLGKQWNEDATNILMKIDAKKSSHSSWGCLCNFNQKENCKNHITAHGKHWSMSQASSLYPRLNFQGNKFRQDFVTNPLFLILQIDASA